ncbi:MAG: hypothetical protein GIX03_16020 [Candidatus Eremiobacteraeota bacterium]|nr:hypothetical protein [Candidatus Eremiobacteraeota bacterium]MBC5804470.1 hypothetical protein [Candidatus Eremiobacteraeota bacterium]MBC5821227.1 hypothetical protein [Candidatus Eremiobacteraeota bacterium]
MFGQPPERIDAPSAGRRRRQLDRAGSAKCRNGLHFVWCQALTGAAKLGAAKLGTVDIGVLVTPHDAAGLMQYAADVSNPHSGRYRVFLTPDQIADRFGASKNDYQTVARYFASKGLAVMAGASASCCASAARSMQSKRRLAHSSPTIRRMASRFIA